MRSAERSERGRGDLRLPADADADERRSPAPVTADVERLLMAAGGIARAQGREATDLADIAAALSELPPPAAPPPARITPYRDGPYLLRGAFELVDQDGEAIATRRSTVALCRCGRSQLRPFCDGTHKLTGFQADSGATCGSAAEDEAEEVSSDAASSSGAAVPPRA